MLLKVVLCCELGNIGHWLIVSYSMDIQIAFCSSLWLKLTMLVTCGCCHISVQSSATPSPSITLGNLIV